MRRRRGGGLVGSGRAAPAGMEIVLAQAGARAAPTAAPRPRGLRGRVRVRVRLRVRVREAGGAVAIELQGGGVAAADLGREVTVVVSGIDGLACRRRCRSRRRGRRLVLGVQRVHEVRAHPGGSDGGGPERAGGAEQAGSAPRLGRTAAGASGAAVRAAGGRQATSLLPPTRARVASEAGQPRALSYWALMPNSCARCLGLAPPPSRVAGPRPAPARRRPPGLSRRTRARPQYNR